MPLLRLSCVSATIQFMDAKATMPCLFGSHAATVYEKPSPLDEPEDKHAEEMYYVVCENCGIEYHVGGTVKEMANRGYDSHFRLHSKLDHVRYCNRSKIRLAIRWSSDGPVVSEYPL